MKKVAVIAHLHKAEALAALEDIREWASAHGVEVVSNLRDVEGEEGRIGAEDDAIVRERFAGADVAVTLGGDGTLLYAAHLVAPLGIPVLAVHLGNLGFHTQVECSRLRQSLDEIAQGRYRTEPRMMLEADVAILPGAKQEFPEGPRLALNDVVVSKTAWGRMIHVRIHVDGEPASDLYADGLLVSTPTGSSAYNYAAGGPVLEPHLDAIVLNAICPHRMHFGPVVLGPEHKIEVEFHPRKPSEEAQILVDGRLWCSVTHEHSLKISRAPVYLRLIVLENAFFRKLRQKLSWGGLI